MYAASNTIAKEPMIAVPLLATTGQSRQNTPIGDNFRIISIHFMKISLMLLHALTIPIFFSPSLIMENPSNRAMTITCSILDSTIGLIKLDGKIFTIVSMTDVFSGIS